MYSTNYLETVEDKNPYRLLRGLALNSNDENVKAAPLKIDQTIVLNYQLGYLLGKKMKHMAHML